MISSCIHWERRRRALKNMDTSKFEISLQSDFAEFCREAGLGLGSRR